MFSCLYGVLVGEDVLQSVTGQRLASYISQHCLRCAVLHLPGAQEPFNSVKWSYYISLRDQVSLWSSKQCAVHC